MTKNPIVWACAFAVVILALSVAPIGIEIASGIKASSDNIAASTWNLRMVTWNLATVSHDARQVTAALADPRSGVARTLRNVNTVTAQIGRTSNVLRLAASDGRQQQAELLRGATVDIGKIGPLIEDLATGSNTILVNVGAATANLNRMVEDIHPQVLGLVAAGKVTMGETATTMRDLRRATPALVESLNQIGKNASDATAASVRASNSTADLMGNLAEQTKPLPKWIRYPFQILGIMAPALSGTVTGMAAAGVFVK